MVLSEEIEESEAEGGESKTQSKPQSIKWASWLKQWAKDLYNVASTLERIRAENAELRKQIDELQRLVDRQTGQLEHIDKLVRCEVKEELDRRYPPKY